MKLNKYITFIIAIYLLFPISTLAMPLYVTKPNGETLTIETESSDMIDAFKTKIKDVSGILEQEQILTHNGKVLEDTRSIADYNIKEGDTIILEYTSNKKITIKLNLTNITSNSVLEINYNNDYQTIFKPDSNYLLPSNIEIKIGTKILDTNTYTYNQDTGEILIPKELINDNIEITAQGILLPPPTVSNNNIYLVILLIISLSILIRKTKKEI